MRSLLFWILVIGGIVYVFGDGTFEGVIDTKEKMEANVGERTVIEKDTLSIVDYSTFNETYTLSDGNKVNRFYAEKNLVK